MTHTETQVGRSLQLVQPGIGDVTVNCQITVGDAGHLVDRLFITDLELEVSCE